MGGHELYIAFEKTRASGNLSESIPLLELNYGLIPDLQIGIGVPYAMNKTQDASERRGVGDIDISAKYRLLDESPYLPTISVFPAITLPTGDGSQGLGNGKSQLFLPLWFQKNWGDWQTNFGGGYRINRAKGSRNSRFLGWQIQKRVAPDLTLGSEVFSSSEEVSGEGSSSGFNIGAVYDVDGHNHMLLSIGHGLSNIQLTNQLSLYIGYQMTW